MSEINIIFVFINIYQINKKPNGEGKAEINLMIVDTIPVNEQAICK